MRGSCTPGERERRQTVRALAGRNCELEGQEMRVVREGVQVGFGYDEVGEPALSRWERTGNLTPPHPAPPLWALAPLHLEMEAHAEAVTGQPAAPKPNSTAPPANALPGPSAKEGGR
ncbi:hypothetical protein [Streptomyces sp. NPDC006463]|uniref:hypothetical protein n=1 Tax=Streptomyces sp. NPDC006463 TaxID=3364746 RepID=UPI00368196C9